MRSPRCDAMSSRRPVAAHPCRPQPPRRTRTFGLGAGRSQVQILSPRLARAPMTSGLFFFSVVVDALDVVSVGVEHERAVVPRVVDGALAGTAVILVARGERGGVERPHGRVVLRSEREV